MWDLESGQLALAPLTGHNRLLSAVAVGERHGRAVIISGSDDQTVRVWVWDLRAGRHAAFWIELQHMVLSVASTAEGFLIGTRAELLRVDPL